MSLRRGAAGWLAALLLAALGVVAPALPAQAATCSGVWVVVGSDARCATSYSTGLVALRSAGFEVQTSGSSFVCRIDGRPDTCTLSTPYWSYWHATRAADGTWGAWQYSTRGATAYTPSAGSAEGWAYGNGTPPTGTPPAGSPASTSTTKPATSSSTARPATSTSKPAASTSKPAASSTQPATSSAQPATSSAQPASSAPAPAATPGSVPPGPQSTDTGATAGPSADAPSPDAGLPQPDTVTIGVAGPSPAAGGTPTAALVTAGVLVAGAAGLGGWALRRRRPH